MIGWIKKKRIKKIERAVWVAATQQYRTRIAMSDKCDFMAMLNHRCQYNAVHAVKAGLAKSVIECLQVDHGQATAHYINQLEDGQYVDYTLGWLYRNSDYRIIREVPENEYQECGEALTALKERLCRGYITWVDRALGIVPGDVC